MWVYFTQSLLKDHTFFHLEKFMWIIFLQWRFVFSCHRINVTCRLFTETFYSGSYFMVYIVNLFYDYSRNWKMYYVQENIILSKFFSRLTNPKIIKTLYIFLTLFRHPFKIPVPQSVLLQETFTVDKRKKHYMLETKLVLDQTDECVQTIVLGYQSDNPYVSTITYLPIYNLQSNLLWYVLSAIL